MYKHQQLTHVAGYYISTVSSSYVNNDNLIYETVVIPDAGYNAPADDAIVISRTGTLEESEHTHRALCALFA